MGISQTVYTHLLMVINIYFRVYLLYLYTEYIMKSFYVVFIISFAVVIICLRHRDMKSIPLCTLRPM